MLFSRKEGQPRKKRVYSISLGFSSADCFGCESFQFIIVIFLNNNLNTFNGRGWTNIFGISSLHDCQFLKGECSCFWYQFGISFPEYG